MHPRSATLSLLILGCFAIIAHAQSSVGVGRKTFRGDGNLRFGRAVENPEALSGVWETSGGQSGAVGIHLELTTSASARLDPPARTPQTWQHLSLGVFERKGTEIVVGEENFFEDNAPVAPVMLENGHLQLHYVMPEADVPGAKRLAKFLGIEEPSGVDLDLIYGSDDCWRGRFHRGRFDSQVTLCRPAPEPGTAPDSLVGTWSIRWLGGRDCIHIFEISPDAFIAWSDSLQVPGGRMFWPMLYEKYGVLAKAHRAKDGEVSLELGAYSPLCCSQTFTGRLSTDRSSLSGAFLPSPNHIPHAAQWTRAAGDSCVGPAAARSPDP